MQKWLFSLVSSLMFVSTWLSASPSVEVGAYKQQSFSPSKGELFSIPLKITEAENIDNLMVQIRTQDNDVISTIQVDTVSGEDLSIRWDGKDSNGNTVPDEAYFPVFVITNKSGETVSLNPSEGTGGEEVYHFEKTLNPGSINYDLPVASRVLIRSGIKNGPMLRTILDWEPRVKGFHAERWDGMDADGVMQVEQTPNVGYLIMGYRLPDHAIITYGNKDQTYRAYREANNWPIKQVVAGAATLERNDKILRQEFFYPVLQQKSPRTLIKLLDAETKKPIHQVKGFQEVIAEVKLHPLDELYLDQERYEVSFFIDNQFISEEERGFVPITWRWSPARHGLEAGKHILTVNVSGYKGQVGVKHLPFELTKESN
ncbi:MAG: FlgD immunoglobulin-like domain containing protein [Neptuniibacter sp.]